jgi:hypothetical protein
VPTEQVAEGVPVTRTRGLDEVTVPELHSHPE